MVEVILLNNLKAAELVLNYTLTNIYVYVPARKIFPYIYHW